MSVKKLLLSEEELPKQWYNIQADLPKPLPPMIHPETKEPVKLPPVLFAGECLKQEDSTDRWITIPEAVRDAYRIWRPTPLYRATQLEKALKTPAKIFYKYEGVSPPGSHKPNTAIAQAYYAKQEGVKRLTTETGNPTGASSWKPSGPRSSPAPAAEPKPVKKSLKATPKAQEAWGLPSAKQWKKPSPTRKPSIRLAV
jgi:predicted alternative tryptophan synthase beta-subunit